MITPNKGFILVKILQDKKTKSGLYLNDSDERPVEGQVLKVGSSVIKEGGIVEDSPVKEGQIIIFKKHSHYELNEYEDDNRLAFIHFDDVLGVKD